MRTIHLTYPIDWTVLNKQDKQQVVAIGDFDGVHLGHRDVIGRALHIAKENQLLSAIMTFDPHPREVLGHHIYSYYLTPLEDRVAQFAKLGVDVTYIVHFDLKFAQLSPEDFVNQVLNPLGIHTVVVGFDFTFGHRGMGTVETLKEVAHGLMDVKVISPFQLEGEKVSSSLIREQLHLGNLRSIKKLLGRYYQLTGKVVEGEKIGRTIGFPTANLDLIYPYVIPRNGVYAVRAHFNNTNLFGVMNIGVRPTVDEEECRQSIEVHLFEFNGEIYGSELTVELLYFIRNERKFPSVEHLKTQIQKDIIIARNIIDDINSCDQTR